jgi:uncharacterized protein YndB with AHSA1/START domain
MTTEIPEQLLLKVQKEIEINAPAAVVWESLIEQMGPGAVMMDGTSANTKLEPWPGGRWYRDLGNNTGHFWGHVQVIKPPKLLEITGPMFMSYPVMSHVQYRITEEPGKCKLTVLHRAMGDIAPEHRKGVVMGWENILTQIKNRITK